MRRWVVGCLLGLIGLTTAILAYAPYLPALLAERFPDLLWSGRGSYVAVAGATSPRPVAVEGDIIASTLAPELAPAFADKDGKALLVYRGGRLVLEHYAQGVTAETRFNSFSMVKSLVGALVYKALAEGRLDSLDQTLGELLPEDRGIAPVTLGRLMSMSAGIHFEGGGSKLGNAAGKDSDNSVNPFGPLARLHFQGLDAIESGLSVTNPGDDAFNYQNVNTALLGEVLERVYAQPLQALLADKIWLPAGAGTGQWRQPGAGQPVSAYCCLYATARDWIRIGAFLAENGTAGSPFLPEPLWRDYLGLDVPLAELEIDHFGQHIRQNVLDRPGQELQGPFTYLLGQGGQTLYLMPQKQLVVYRAGENIALLHSTLYGAWNSLPPEARQ